MEFLASLDITGKLKQLFPSKSKPQGEHEFETKTQSED